MRLLWVKGAYPREVKERMVTEESARESGINSQSWQGGQIHDTLAEWSIRAKFKDFTFGLGLLQIGASSIP